MYQRSSIGTRVLAEAPQHLSAILPSLHTHNLGHKRQIKCCTHRFNSSFSQICVPCQVSSYVLDVGAAESWLVFAVSLLCLLSSHPSFDSSVCHEESGLARPPTPAAWNLKHKSFHYRFLGIMFHKEQHRPITVVKVAGTYSHTAPHKLKTLLILIVNMASSNSY